MFENKLTSIVNGKSHTRHKVLNIIYALTGNIMVWLLNDDLTHRPLKKYVWMSDGVFDFSKILKF